jgi:hypothetical protein
MRILSILILSVGLTSALAAQAPATPDTAPKKKVVHVVPPPLSARPSAANRLNTAQRAALINDKPGIKQLPSFTATNRDGQPVAAAALPKSSHWLLLYRRDNCVACDRLMTVLAANGTAAPKNGLPYVILVGGNQPNGLEMVRARYATLGDATWLADKNNEVFAALKPQGAPMLYGMDGVNVAWSVGGNLGDPARIATMASGWLATPAAPTNNVTPVAPSAAGGAK